MLANPRRVFATLLMVSLLLPVLVSFGHKDGPAWLKQEEIVGDTDFYQGLAMFILIAFIGLTSYIKAGLEANGEQNGNTCDMWGVGIMFVFVAMMAEVILSCIQFDNENWLQAGIGFVLTIGLPLSFANIFKVNLPNGGYARLFKIRK